MKKLNNDFLLYIALACFLISFALPGVVYQPRVEDNPKHPPQTILCEVAHRPSAFCYQIVPESPIDHAICDTPEDLQLLAPEYREQAMTSSKVTRDVLDYCGTDWNTPVSYTDFGYDIFAVGWLGPFLGNFAWYANIIAIIGIVVGIRIRKFRAGRNYFILAILLGLQAFMLDVVPIDEIGNSRIVEHLAIGYYVWELSFVLLFLYCILQLRKTSSSE